MPKTNKTPTKLSHKQTERSKRYLMSANLVENTENIIECSNNTDDCSDLESNLNKVVAETVEVSSETTKLEKHDEDLQEAEMSSASNSYDPLVGFEALGASDKEKPKVLVQRVFHQTGKDIVEKKLDYVFGHSDNDLTKHVFGGLFNNKYYPYIPENYCKKHAQNLLEFKDESLPEIGDKFDSLQSFRLYINKNAMDWKYYLKCADSHRKNGKDSFVFQCVFAKPRNKAFLAKGLRKRTRALPLRDCPCRVVLKPVPAGADDLTVIYVCHHHDHPLSDEYFQKLQHGRRLHPSVKEEIMDLLSLEVDREIIKNYFKSLTGYSMNTGYFANMLIQMKKNNVNRQISVERLKSISKKIKKIKDELGIPIDDDNADNETEQPNKLVEVINVLNTVSTPKRSYTKRARSKIVEEVVVKTEYEEPKRRKSDSCEQTELMESRLETCLQQLKNDKVMLHNVKCLQDSVKTDKINHSEFIEPSNSQSDNFTETEEELIPEIVTEDVECNNGQDVIYETVIGFDETSENIQENENGIYCVQIENDETYVFYDNLENLQNEPVQVQATELATINIIPDHITKEITDTETNLETDDNQESNTEFHNSNNQDFTQSPDDFAKESFEDSINLDKDNVFEVIETSNKKILPNRDFVRNEILNRRPFRKPTINKQYIEYFQKHQAERLIKQQENKVDDIADISELKVKSKSKKKTPKKKQPDLSENQELGSIKDENIPMETDIDLSEIKDNEHYIIVVDSDDNDNATIQEFVEPLPDEVTELIDEPDSTPATDIKVKEKKDYNICDIHVQRDELEEHVHKLNRYKYILKRELKILRETKTKILKDITQAKRTYNKIKRDIKKKTREID